MQFDELDKKFREAADNHHPAYDEKAWSKMENLLDRHLPKGDNRRRFLFLLFLIVGLTTAGIFILKPKSSQEKVLSGTKTGMPVNNREVSPVQTPVEPVNTNPVTTIDPGVEAVKTGPGQGQQVMGKTTTQSFFSNQPRKLNNPLSHQNKQVVSKEEIPAANSTIKEQMNTSKPVNPSLVTGKTNPEAVSSQANKQNTSLPSSIQNGVANEPLKNNPVTVIEPVAEKTASTNKPGKKTKNTGSFFFFAGGGPDVSFIKMDKPGSTKLFGGAGLGYTFNNRVTVRAGFFSGRKIYNAAAEDYNASPAFYVYYPYLQEVDADCLIHEVPVAVSYHFARTAKGNFFATAGVSSYFMKKETYTYYYKNTPTGPTYKRDWTIRDENQHYFAGLTLSGGYNRQVGTRVSIGVEPYVKIPIKGVGNGNVKLNSTGVLFSVGVRPFGPK